MLSEGLLLSSLAVEQGRLALPSGMEYRVLVLPDHRVLSLGALREVDRLVRAGATVLGPKPMRAVSLEGGTEGKELFEKLADDLCGPGEQAEDAKGTRKVGKGRVAWGMPVRNLLQADGVAPDVTFQDEKIASAINWIHYRIDNADVYFLSEPSDKPLAIELGQVEDLGIARVTLNGKDLGVVWRPPFRVNVSKVVKRGENRLSQSHGL